MTAAEEAFERGLKLNPHHVDALCKYGSFKIAKHAATLGSWRTESGDKSLRDQVEELVAEASVLCPVP
jgi:hypothetical protein